MSPTGGRFTGTRTTSRCSRARRRSSTCGASRSRSSSTWRGRWWSRPACDPVESAHPGPPGARRRGRHRRRVVRVGTAPVRPLELLAPLLRHRHADLPDPDRRGARRRHRPLRHRGHPPVAHRPRVLGARRDRRARSHVRAAPGGLDAALPRRRARGRRGRGGRDRRGHASAATRRSPRRCRGGRCAPSAIISYGVYLWHWPVFVYLDARRAHLHGWPLFAVQAAVTLAARDGLLPPRGAPGAARRGTARRMRSCSRRSPLCSQSRRRCNGAAGADRAGRRHLDDVPVRKQRILARLLTQVLGRGTATGTARVLVLGDSVALTLVRASRIRLLPARRHQRGRLRRDRLQHHERRDPLGRRDLQREPALPRMAGPLLRHGARASRPRWWCSCSGPGRCSTAWSTATG